MKQWLKALGFFAVRGLIAGAVVGFIVGVVDGIRGGETGGGNFIGTGVFGLIYGGLLTLAVGLVAGVVTEGVSRVAHQWWIGVAVAFLIGLFAPLGLGALLFAGPFNDPFFITMMVLEGLVIGGIAFLWLRPRS